MRPTILLLSLVFLSCASAADYIINNLFAVDAPTCEARHPPGAEGRSHALKTANKPFQEARALLKRTLVTSKTIWNPTEKYPKPLNPRANALLNAHMNAAHIMWGIRPPELYSDARDHTNRLEVDSQPKLVEVQARLRDAQEFMKGDAVDERRLTPETATLACSEGAYELAIYAYQIDERVERIEGAEWTVEQVYGIEGGMWVCEGALSRRRSHPISQRRTLTDRFPRRAVSQKSRRRSAERQARLEQSHSQRSLLPLHVHDNAHRKLQAEPFFSARRYHGFGRL